MVTKTPEITDRKPRARTRNGTAHASWKQQKRSSPAPARTQAWRISPRKRVSDRGLCIDTFPRVRTCSSRFTGPRWKKLAAAERTLADSMSPVEALRAWLLLFVDAVATKQIIAPVLNTLVGNPKKVFEASYAQIHQALRALVKRAIKGGDIRKDLDPIDLLRAIVGVANVATSPDWQASARRLVDILIAGARPIR